MSYSANNAMDELVEQVLMPISKRGSFPILSLSLVNLSIIDRKLSERLALKVNHIFSNDDVDLSSSKYSKLLKDCVSASSKGLPFVDASTLSKSIVSNKQSLVPFLISSFSGGEASLRGFSSNEKTFWFATTDVDRKNRFSCISDSGDVRFVNVSKLEEKGFSEISGDQKSIMKICKSDVLKDSNKQEILEAGVYVSSKIQPIVKNSSSVAILSKFMSTFPGIGDKPEKKVNVTPKF